MEGAIYTSLRQFQRHCFPREYHQKLIDTISPEQQGRYEVKRILREFRKILGKSIASLV